MARTYIELCLAGEAQPDEIDDYIDCWHDGEGAGKPLHEFLGITPEEYAAWAELRMDEAEIVERHRETGG